MARIATTPRFAPDTRKTLSRDPRDFHHGLLEDAGLAAGEHKHIANPAIDRALCTAEAEYGLIEAARERWFLVMSWVRSGRANR